MPTILTSSSGANLLRHPTSSKILTVPFWLRLTYKLSASPYDSDYRTARVSWKSPDYYPSDPPGPYGRSSCQSGLLSMFPVSQWGYDVYQLAGANCQWGYEQHTGYTFSYATASFYAVIYDTRPWSGLSLSGFRFQGDTYNSPSGSGAATVSLRVSSTTTLGTSLAWLGGNQSFTVTGTSLYTYSASLQLGSYLIVCFYISDLRPPSSPAGYPAYAIASFKGNAHSILIE